MKRLYLLSTLMLFLAMAMLPHKTKAQTPVWDGRWKTWTQGSVIKADSSLFENAQQLAYLAYRANNGLDVAGGHISNLIRYYKLMTDVNLNGSEDYQRTLIGYWISNTNYYSFSRHFDGNNNNLSGLYINSDTNRFTFFDYIQMA